MTEDDEDAKDSDLELALDQMEEDLGLSVTDRKETLIFLANQFEIPAPISTQDIDG